jgi:antirestriction protein ArdC
MTAQEAQQLVHTSVQQLLDDPEQWRRWATTLSRFPRYSPGNVMLILAQRPDATYVGGYRAWQQLGRQVLKGEHGITILAPMVNRGPGAETERDPDAAATVFDIAQTTGRDLAIPQPQLLSGDTLREVLTHVIDQAVPVPVQFAPSATLHGANGTWSPRDQRITLAADRAPDQQLKTLLHEWAHSVGVPDVAAAHDRHRGHEEIIAETAAYVLAQRLGLDTAAYSLPYVGSWAEGDPQKVRALTQRVAERVQALSAILDQAAHRDPVIAAALGVPALAGPAAAADREAG